VAGIPGTEHHIIALDVVLLRLRSVRTRADERGE
jgi:hypothetical protein